MRGRVDRMIRLTLAALRMFGPQRKRNALINLFELWVGLAGVVSGIVYFYSPASLDNNSIARVVGHHMATVWSVGYFIAGLLIILGLIWPQPQWEIAGLWLLGAATAINGLAVLYIFGLRGIATSLTFMTLTLAAWIRGHLVARALDQYASLVDDGASAHR